MGFCTPPDLCTTCIPGVVLAGEKESFWKKRTLYILEKDVMKANNVHNPSNVSKYIERLENTEDAQLMNSFLGSLSPR